jgi:hypothetical protein
MKRKTSVFPLLLLAAGLLVCREAEAQNEMKETFKNTLAVQPLYWVNNGFRIDYERQLNTPKHWLQVSGIGYYVEDEDIFWNLWMNSGAQIDKTWGAGLEVNYKYFPFKRPVMYFSGGLAFSHFNVDYCESGYQFISYENDGLTYYEPEWQTGNATQYFNRVGTNLYLGFQNRPARRFLIDGYTGVGYTYSFYDKNKYSPDRYLNSLSYRGISFTIGFRIGFRL